MTPLQAALTRKPADLTTKHVELARLLLGRPEGAAHLHVHERAFRDLASDLSTSRWLPVICDRRGGEGKYRIAGPSEGHLARAESDEDHARAVSLNKRGQGRMEAFRAHHSAGSLFAPDIPDLEAV